MKALKEHQVHVCLEVICTQDLLYKGVLRKAEPLPLNISHKNRGIPILTIKENQGKVNTSSLSDKNFQKRIDKIWEQRTMKQKPNMDKKPK